ncbi:helix-turn-helix transcriptional regulator [Budviciaceae bacterium BWR-B9]|uniref:Helix-turn-helix transcriptional regulator n=1 Tax=Limnobaculum allomyrinae TaxID=2791986 RepID=A0ABS1IXP3_9GAMM|nr:MULTISPECIES: helix-turn-helix transcriptional regulator [Limnobaculum]MBK5145960.1 helix-turn-helix transcriptional regulator [Limnobaculum allomyrinae]MBV7693985.1 helix-turn-helix domain-containing protein [Limnobaculum sp. M2-1]
MSTFGERLKEERSRLRLNQEEFAALGGVRRGAQVNYEKDERAPDSNYMTSIANNGVDIQYVLTGNRSRIEPLGSTMNYASLGKTTSIAKVGNSMDGLYNKSEVTPVPLNKELLHRIAVMLESAAKQAGKRWTMVQMIDTTALVYNFLIQEEIINDEKIERTLKLVVNN